MPLSLARNDKVLKPSDCQVIFKNGKPTKGKYWQIIARKTNTMPRLGLVISKKVHKLAVERNRYKRVAREVFRIHQGELNNWDFVVVAKHAKLAGNTIMAKDLLNLFHKIIKN